MHRLNRFTHEAGYSYIVELPPGLAGDSPENPAASALELFEDGRLLGPRHSEHAQIRSAGAGRYSHWGQHLYLSAADNTDPRYNGREYYVYVPSYGTNSKRARVDALTQQLRPDLTSWEAYALAEALFYEVVPGSFIGEFGKSCWTDAEFVADYQRLVPNNRRSFERKFVVAQLVRALNHLAGDMAECGVYNGATAYFMAKAARDAGQQRRLHLFDSFSGLSRPGVEDGGYWNEGALAIPEASVRSTLEGFADTAIYAGWIPERFAEVADRAFAFVHIDVDLYQPTLDSVRFFYERVSQGGMIVCDDYGFTTCPGARSAFQEFMAEKPERIIELPTGQGLVIRV